MILNAADLYREIGKKFREYGAQRIALLSSKTYSDGKIKLEVAVDGMIDEPELHRISQEQWPYVQMKILNLNDEKYMYLIDEVIEDSIIL